MTASQDPFAPAVVTAVCNHMNADHAEDSLLIVRSLGGLPDASTATMTDIVADGAVFTASVEDTERTVTVPWAIEIRERGDLRLEMVRMYHEACEALGIEPRAAGEH